MIRVHCDICDGLIPENLSGDSITFDEKINGVVYEIQMYLRGSVIRKEDKNLRLFSNTKRLVLCRDCLSELAMKYSRDIIPQPIFKLVKNNKEADKNNLIGQLWDIVHTWQITSAKEDPNIAENLIEELLTLMKNYDPESYKELQDLYLSKTTKEKIKGEKNE